MASATCDLDQSTVDSLHEFRLRKSKTTAAHILKIDLKALKIVPESFHDPVTIAELADELPETSPRYIVLSYALAHRDGRVSYPLVFLFYCPPGVKTELNMIYSSAKNFFVEKNKIPKIIDIHELSDLTDEFLQEKLL